MEKVWECFCSNLGEKYINFPYKKRAQLSVLSKKQRGLPEYFKCGKIACRGSAPDPAGGAYSAPPDLAGGKGAGCPLPKNPFPLSALRASNLVAFGHSFHAP